MTSYDTVTLLRQARDRLVGERAAANVLIRDLTTTIDYLDKAIAELTFDPPSFDEQRW